MWQWEWERYGGSKAPARPSVQPPELVRNRKLSIQSIVSPNVEVIHGQFKCRISLCTVRPDVRRSNGLVRLIACCLGADYRARELGKGVEELEEWEWEWEWEWCGRVGGVGVEMVWRGVGEWERECFCCFDGAVA